MNKIITLIFLLIFCHPALANWMLYQASADARTNDYSVLLDLSLIVIYIYLWYRYLHNWTVENAYYGAIFPMIVTLLSLFYRELYVLIRGFLINLF
jgi:hypothetical protein